MYCLHSRKRCVLMTAAHWHNFQVCVMNNIHKLHFKEQPNLLIVRIVKNFSIIIVDYNVTLPHFFFFFPIYDNLMHSSYYRECLPSSRKIARSIDNIQCTYVFIIF